MTFEGEFRPGGPGVSTMPIPMLGRGSVAVGTDGLTVTGTRKRISPLLILTAIVAMCAIAFAAGMFVGEDIANKSTKAAALLALGIGAGFASFVLGRGKIVDYAFMMPWRFVRAVEVLGDGEVVVTIKGATPRGTLHFAPTHDSEKLRTSIKEKLST